jgi:acyl carrier protein
VGRTLDANRWLAGSACGKRRRGRPLNSVVRRLVGLEAVELHLGVEELFEIEIPDEEAAAILTIGALRDYIVEKLTAAGRANVNDDIVLDQLRTIIPHHLNVTREQVTPDAKFEDLYE